jgi:hypothetical protein
LAWSALLNVPVRKTVRCSMSDGSALVTDGSDSEPAKMQRRKRVIRGLSGQLEEVWVSGNHDPRSKKTAREPCFAVLDQRKCATFA